VFIFIILSEVGATSDATTGCAGAASSVLIKRSLNPIVI
jgi:hypothetical protein